MNRLCAPAETSVYANTVFRGDIFRVPGNTTQGFWALVLNGLRGMLSAMYMMYVNIFEFVLQRLT